MLGIASRLNGVALHWSLNTLFSSKALQNLAKKSKCTPRREVKCQLEGKYRTIDGTCNNVINPLFGSAPRILNRLVPAKYFDFEKLNEPIGFPGQHLVPSIPETFKVVGKFIRPQPKPSRRRLTNSHLLMQFGQFLDHDVGISLESESSDECQEMKNGRPVRNFEVPCYTIQGFRQFRALPFARSASECQIRNGRYTRREQLNSDTSFVDASQVYGSTDELAERLRENKGKGGKGLLATSNGVNGRFLPINTEELEGPVNLCNNEKSGGKCFLSGDVRTNEQPGLASMHTLFVREHNRIARELSKINPSWKNEKLYQEARKILGAVWQKMTYVDFLPIIIGETLPPYPGYNPNVNADLTNGFSTAAFRFGHTLIRPAFDVLDANFNPIMNPLPLREMFFNTSFIIKRGIDPILLGLLGNSSERFDRKLANDLLQHLFQEPGSSEGGLNLAALNVQRGREHGLPGYNAYRRFCGLRNARNFQATRREIRNGWNRILLRRLYKKPSIADLWIAGLAEAPANGGIVGATFGCIIREQFRRLRDGDSFFYRRPGVFTAEQLIEIEKVTMSRILCDNLKKIVSIQRNAFLAGGGDVRRVECSNIPGINFNVWKGMIVSNVRKSDLNSFPSDAFFPAKVSLLKD
ncbi:eosinophil peroxidase-like [Dendronephthya gigantea]|uniref:eosinophil peroxidase-like n=1 Tax=Dendronephthya gigantea TaxID=151771 RepID=UPI00106BECA6|nr:eosinophil peroxidase-like [Dendronephthya gigantea]